MRRFGLISAVLVTALLAVSAPAHAGGGGHGAACAGFSEGRSVALLDHCLDGTAHFLPADEDLQVVNDGAQAHDYVAVDGSFETATLAPGEETTVANPGPGVYRVYCSLHSSPEGNGMAGVLVVGDGEGDAEAAAEQAGADEAGAEQAGADEAGAEQAEGDEAAAAWLSGGSGWSALAAATIGVAALGIVAMVAVSRRDRGATAPEHA